MWKRSAKTKLRTRLDEHKATMALQNKAATEEETDVGISKYPPVLYRF